MTHPPQWLQRFLRAAQHRVGGCPDEFWLGQSPAAAQSAASLYAAATNTCMCPSTHKQGSPGKWQGCGSNCIRQGTGDLSRVSILTRGMLKPGGATLFLSDLGFCLALLQAWVLEQQVGWVQQRCDVGLAWLEPPLLVVPWGPLFHVAASVTHLGLTLRPACTVRWHTWPLAV